jgi:hypothetical protein
VGLQSRWRVAVAVFVGALAASACDDLVANTTGTVRFAAEELICIAPEDLEQSPFCATGSPKQLEGIPVGACVRVSSDFSGAPGGTGTAEHPERLTSIRILGRSCEHSDRELGPELLPQ